MLYYDTAQRTVGEVLADKARSIGKRPFLRFPGAEFSYAEVDRVTNSFANGFARLGIGKGDHVAIMIGNHPEFLWALWGLGKIGAVAVPLNTAAKGQLLRYFLSQSESVALCVSAEFVGRALPAIAELPAIRHVLVHGLPGQGIDGLGLPVDRTVGHLEDFATMPGNAPACAEPPTARDPHLVLYTSGTTGPSKGAVSPHSQGHAVGHQMATINGYGPEDVLHTCLPLFHGNALWYTLYAGLWAEACVAVYPHFSASQFWDQIRESRATVFNCLGAMANIIWQRPPSPRDRDHRARICMMVPTSTELASGFQDRFGVRVTSVYAMTENCAVAVFAPDDPRDRIPAAGKVRDYMSVQIVDDDGRELPRGEIGEIAIRPNERGIVMLGYYKMGEATVEATRDLWFHTGDRGYLSEDGFLYFADRKKEAIRRRGENISGYEVESIICGHPAVREAAAVPVASDLSEDDVMVYIVRAPDVEVSYSEIIDYCSRNMAYFMVPRYLQFIDELPKTPSEKIEKYRLKQLAAANVTSLWDREAAGISVER